MSLLVRLFFVVAVALLPVVLVEAVDAIEHRSQMEQQLRAQATRLASVVAMDQDRVFEVARRYLGAVAQLGPIARPDARCGDIMARMAAPYPAFAYLARYSRDGTFECGSPGSAAFAAVATRPFFRHALETGNFAIGTFMPDPGGGVLPVGMPVRNPAGDIDGVVVAAIDLAQLTASLHSGLLPQGASLVVADADGTILARLPEGADGPGMRLAAAHLALVHGAAAGAAEGLKLDGSHRIYGYEPVEAMPGGSGVFIEVGLDRDLAYAGIEADGMRQIVALNGALALGIFMAWMYGRQFIARPAARLASAAQRWREGDWSARSALNDPDSEFGQLSLAFDAMADAVSDRERRMREAFIEAAAANQARADFMSTMNHELRTPLTPIVGFAEVMVRELEGPLPVRYLSYAHDIKQCSEHLLAAVDGILDLSRAASGKLALVEGEIDPLAAVAAALRTVEAQAQSSGLGFALEAEPALPALRCDAQKLRQMLANLLSNAIRFTPPGGRIEVTVACRDGALAIAVRDTGAGIAAEHLPHVVEPFFRAHDAFVRGNEGTGLGLALVKAMIELHGGRLVLASEVGKGTEATILFPASRSVFACASEAA